MKQIKPYKIEGDDNYYLRRWTVSNKKVTRIVTILIVESYTSYKYEYYAGSTILNPEDVYNNKFEMKIVEGRAHKMMNNWYNMLHSFAILSSEMKSQKILNGFFQKILSNIIRKTISKLPGTKGKLDVEELEGDTIPKLIVEQPMV